MMAWQKYYTILLTLGMTYNTEACSISQDYSIDFAPCILTCTDYLNNDELQLGYDPYNYRNGYRQYQEQKCIKDNSLYIKTLIYKETELHDTIPLTSGSNTQNILNAIYKLDLSDNDYEITPDIKIMSNLNSLDISRNRLTVAKLSNAKELRMLSEIDLSYNFISEIQVNKNLQPYRNLKKIEMSHNELVKLPNAIFEEFSNLQILNLSYNHIELLSVTTFEGTRKLIILDLSNNRLKSINTSLFRFNELELLNLSNNQIANLKSDDFEQLHKLETLDLSFNNLKVIDVNVFKSVTFLKSLDLSYNILESIDYDAFTNLIILNSIDISVNKIKSLPLNIFQNSKILNFSITTNMLEGSLKRGMFSGLNVTKLDFSNQFLTEVNDYAFENIYQLNELFLNSNSIESLSNKCFLTLINLEVLDLSRNKITNISFEKKDLSKLKSFIVKNNRITEIKDKELDQLTNLEFLDLSENLISHLLPNSFQALKKIINLKIHTNVLFGTLESHTFNGLVLLPSLDISHNMLNKIENGSFANMYNLNQLNLANCQISELHYNAFVNTGYIKTLDLSYNRLTDFHINSTQLRMLSVLLLNNNLIKSLSSTSLEGMFLVKKIILSHNVLENVPNELLYSQVNLTHLDISFNEKFNFTPLILQRTKNLDILIISNCIVNFKYIANGTQITNLVISNAGITNVSQLSLGKIVNLSTLDLSFNNVSSLHLGDFDNISSLKLLNLSFNKISFIQPGLFKDNTFLISLNISHNHLFSINYGIFRGLDSLEILDMSYNNIRDLENERFYEIQELTQLIIDFNQIDYINSEDFGGTKLSILSIGHNPIPCQLLVNLINARKFEITAIQFDEHNNENVNGIVCNKGRMVESQLVNNASNINKEFKYFQNIMENIINKNYEQELSETKYFEKMSSTLERISEILTINNNTKNIMNSKDEQKLSETKYLAKISSTLEKFSQILIINNSTNILLNKIFNSFNQTSINTGINLSTIPVSTISRTANHTPAIKENASITQAIDNVSYITNVKKELENLIAREKQNIMAQIERKFTSNINSTVPLAAHSDQEQLTHDVDNKQYLFTETYVSLILSVSVLILLIGLLLYRLYKSKTNRSFSISTHILPGAMENSTL